MLIHTLLYLLIAAAYAEGAAYNLRRSRNHTALREISIALMHAALAATMVLEHSATALSTIPPLA